MIETHRRRECLAQHAPTADAQWAEAIIAADPLWGPDQDWKLLIDQTTTAAAIPTPPAADDDDSVGEKPAEPTIPATPNDTARIGSGPNDDETGLAALEVDLLDLYRP